jgi:hypothetical protein
MYYIKQIEFEGWQRAYVVFFGNKEMAAFMYRDSAEYWISEHIA